jgi:probable non-F420 flavinoid oxidoreductase
MCSDHFHPWSERQGHSGFAWSWLGAALESTALSFGTVCAPGQRYHPAIVAQAAATLAEMYPGRFWLAVGSGEALNEHITGHDWPSKTDRQRRLAAAVEVMRALWAGETVSRDGPVVTREARLYTRPPSPPLLVGAALTPQTAKWVGSWADALITVAGPRDRMRAIVDAFKAGGGDGRPMFLQVTLSYAATDAQAAQSAQQQWPQCALDSALLADLPTVADFDRHCEQVDARDVLTRVRASAAIERHADWIEQDAALGFERIYLHNVARDNQERFIEACARELIPRFSDVQAGRLAS